MTRKLLSILASVALAGCGEANDQSFAESFDRSMVSSCIESSTKGGVPQDIANRICECAKVEVNKRFSMAEKISLSDQNVEIVMTECVKQVMPQQ